MRLTIQSLEIRAVLLPLKRPVVARVGSFDQWPIMLLDLQTAEGPVGRAYLEPYLQHSIAYIAPILVDLAKRFKGVPLGPAELFDKARASLSLVGREGLTLAAVSLLDMAFWDASAKAAGLPLASYLGGSPGDVPAYNSNGLWLTDPAPQEQEAFELVGEGGFKGLKLRLGRDRLEDDLSAISAVRRGAGNDILLMVDFNQGLTLDKAIRRCQELDDQGIYWFEEPILYDNYTGFAELRRRLSTPIQIGENFWGPRQAHQALLAGAADFIMPDFMRIGGVTGWQRTAAIAGAHGTPVSTHLYPETGAHVMRATETAHWLEWQDWADAILLEPFEMRDGNLVVPDRPGCGIEWNEEAVRKYAFDF